MAVQGESELSGKIAQPPLAPKTAVELNHEIHGTLEVEAGGAAGSGMGGEVTAVDQFQFEGAPEACAGGIVVAVAPEERDFVNIVGTTDG